MIWDTIKMCVHNIYIWIISCRKAEPAEKPTPGKATLLLQFSARTEINLDDIETLLNFLRKPKLKKRNQNFTAVSEEILVLPGLDSELKLSGSKS